MTLFQELHHYPPPMIDIGIYTVVALILSMQWWFPVVRAIGLFLSFIGFLILIWYAFAIYT